MLVNRLCLAQLAVLTLTSTFVVLLVVDNRLVLGELDWLLNGRLGTVLEFGKRAFRVEGNLVLRACQHSLAGVYFAFVGKRWLHEV